jgi:hypothetical protein
MTTTAHPIPTTATAYADLTWLRSETCREIMKRAGRTLYDNHNRRELWMDSQFFGGPPASAKSRAHLARLLRTTTAAPELVADLRVYFNSLHGGGDHITQADVSTAIRLLSA